MFMNKTYCTCNKRSVVSIVGVHTSTLSSNETLRRSGGGLKGAFLSGVRFSFISGGGISTDKRKYFSFKQVHNDQ